MECKAYNLKKVQEISGGDEAFVKDMVDAFFENVTDSIAKIKTFKQSEDWKSIGGIAHKLASNFSYMGADSLHDIADNIEKSVLIEQNLTDIAAKTDKLCSDSLSLLNQMKEDVYVNSLNQNP